MKTYTIVTIALLTHLLSGCASYRPISAGVLPIVVVAMEERAIRLGARATLPAGDYLPDFQSDRGIFYIAPTSVNIRSLGMNFPLRGGLFIPSPTVKDQRQAAWVQQASGGNALGVLLSGGGTAIEVFPFDDPIKYTIKSKGPNQSVQPTPTAVTPRAKE